MKKQDQSTEEAKALVSQKDVVLEDKSDEGKS